MRRFVLGPATRERSAEGRESSIQGRSKRKAEDELHEKIEARRIRSIEGGDELPILKQCHQLLRMRDGEVIMRSPGPSTQLKRPRDHEPGQEDQPPVLRAPREILCSLVDGNLDHGDNLGQEAKEIKLVVQAPNGGLARLPGRGSLRRSGSRRNRVGQLLDALVAQKKGAEQAKKVELGNFEHSGCMKSWREREVMEQTPGATILSVKWVVTNKGTPQAPMPKAPHVYHENL